MNDKQFANLIVDKLALPEKSQARQFHSNNGLATSRLGEADEIWRLFVRYNLDTGGMKSSIVENQWNKIDTDNILKRRDKLVEGLGRLRKEKCYENFTVFCPMRFKKGDGFEKKGCTVPDCAVIDLTRSISWHRRHYRIAKVIAECAKRLLVDNQTVYHANLNNLVSQYGINTGVNTVNGGNSPRRNLYHFSTTSEIMETHPKLSFGCYPI